MLVREKKTFKEFSSSEEGIATGILASRLKLLKSFGLKKKENCQIKKRKHLTPLRKRH